MTYIYDLIQICTQKRNRTFWQLVWYRTVYRICINSAALYQFYKTALTHAIHTDMCVLIWYCPDAAAVLIQLRKYARNRTFWQRNCSRSEHFWLIMAAERGLCLCTCNEAIELLAHFCPRWLHTEPRSTSILNKPTGDLNHVHSLASVSVVKHPLRAKATFPARNEPLQVESSVF